jgi:general secretion pathway protein D
VQYFLKGGIGSVGFTPFSQATQAISAVLPGFNLLLGPQADPRTILTALSSKTDVKVLSTPSVVVLDNQVATIQVGDQVPVATTQATLVGTTSSANAAFPVANNIDYRNTGVILRVLPRVSANGNVTLEIDQEISNVVNNGSQGSLTPTVAQRHVRSTISVTSSQTVLLGGLISDRTTSGRSGIPILSEIAYLGDLFARKQTARDRTELIIFIKPQIIADSLDAQAVAEQMRSKLLLSNTRNLQTRASSKPLPVRR